MIGAFDEEAAIATDAYIDLLLDRQAPADATPAHTRPLPASLRATIELLQHGLPRFHPSFLFEEELAARLRQGVTDTSEADLVRLTIPAPALRKVDPRVLLGGAAIASGVSVAAVYAFRHAARRATRAGREVPA